MLMASTTHKNGKSLGMVDPIALLTLHDANVTRKTQNKAKEQPYRWTSPRLPAVFSLFWGRTHVYKQDSSGVYIYIYVYVCVHMHGCLSVCPSVCLSVCMHACMHVCMYKCVCVCLCEINEFIYI